MCRTAHAMLIRPCHHIKQCRSRSETHLGDVHASKSMHAITSWQRTVVGRVTCRFDMKLQICKRCFELAKKPSEKIGDLAITTRHSNTLPACVLWWSLPRCLQAPVTPTLDIKPSASGRIADAGVRTGFGRLSQIQAPLKRWPQQRPWLAR